MALGGAPIIGCGTDGGDTGEPEPTARVADASFAPPPGAPNPEPGADLPVGTVIDDSIIIANGRLITPQGNQLASPRFVTKIVTSPDGEYAYYVSMADRRVVALDLDTLTVSDTLILDGAFNGLVLNAAGDKMWVGGGGANDVFEIEVTGGELTLSNTIQLYGYPTAVVLSPDEQTLYVAVMWGRELYAIDTVTGSVIRRWTTGLFPYDIALNASGSRAYVTNIGGESVTVVNTNTSQVVDTISVGKNPEGSSFIMGKFMSPRPTRTPSASSTRRTTP
ncbi:MAG: YncE family protein [Deltaproteobacteria bacterium]|nr:YncE family protein [Deltaproteobacteria bacterium]